MRAGQEIGGDDPLIKVIDLKKTILVQLYTHPTDQVFQDVHHPIQGGDGSDISSVYKLKYQESFMSYLQVLCL